LLSISECMSSDTCDGFYVQPTELVCISEGICIESSVVDEDEGTLTTTIVSNDDSRFGIGFSTPGGGMNGGGEGSDIFVCSEEGLRRFLVNAKANPGTTATETVDIFQDEEDDEVIQNLCILDADSGTGRMTFTRKLDDGPRVVVPGQVQAIIWARGPLGQQALTSQHPTGRRGEVSLDFTNLSGGLSQNRTKAPWILWCHIIFMSLSWGLFLPLAVILANRTRNMGAAGRWFAFHKGFARLGWTLQTMGAIFGVYYCEVYSEHVQFSHTIFGILIVIAGFLQPISAVIRPHPPKGGWVNGKSAMRVAFEIYHKGIGWTATICGMINVFLGARLAKDLSFEDAVSLVPSVVGYAGVALFFLVIGWSLVAQKRE